MYQKILTDPLKFPSNMPSTARSIIGELLQRDPSKRLGAGGAEEIKKHLFFASIDWVKCVILSVLNTASLFSLAHNMHHHS